MPATISAIFRGPNIYSLQPVVCAVFPRYEDLDQAGLVASLADVVPGMVLFSDRSCADPDGAHFLVHLLVALQNLAGAQLACPHSTAAVAFAAGEVCEQGKQLLVIPFEHEAVAVRAVSAAADIVEGAYDDLASYVEKYIASASRKLLPIQDRALIATARSRGIPCTVLARRIIAMGQGRYQKRLSATKTSSTNIVSNDIAANKDYTRRVLADLGLPIPKYARVRRMSAALKAGAQIGFPLVVKPNNGNMGAAVSIGIKNRKALRAAYRLAKARGRSVLVEEFIEGSDYRLLIIDGKFHAASKRVPAHVVGDGALTIEQLVEITNQDPRRGSGPNKAWTRIRMNEQSDALIEELGYQRDSIPKQGETVWLRRNANTSDGGSSFDVTDEVHPDNIRIAERAALAIGLDIAGVDILCADISRSMWEHGGIICEINSRPGIRKHIWPGHGVPRDLTIPIIDMLFPKGSPFRIPLVVVAGADGGAIAAELSGRFTDAGFHVGLVDEGLVTSGSNRSAGEPLPLPLALRRVMLDPEVNLAVVQLTLDDIIRHGIEVDHIDCAVITEGASPAVSHAGSDALRDHYARAESLIRSLAGNNIYQLEADASIADLSRSLMRLIA